MGKYDDTSSSSSSSSSESSDSENEIQEEYNPPVDTQSDREEDSNPKQSSNESDKDEDSTVEEPKDEDEPPAMESPGLPVVVDDSSSSSSDSSEDEEDKDDKAEEKPEDIPKDSEDEKAKSSSESSSSSSSESEDENEEDKESKHDKSDEEHTKEPETIPEPAKEDHSLSSSSSSECEDEDMAKSLANALAEREKDQHKEPELGARRPSSPNPPGTPDFMETPDVGSFDFHGDPSLGARTAMDFEDTPPALPPKMKNQPVLMDPSDVPSSILHAPDKNATLGRGRWSDDDSEVPGAHNPTTVVHVPRQDSPDSQRRRRKRSTSRHRSKERSRSRSKPRSSHQDNGPRHTVIDVRRPYHDDAINPQAMVSLYAPNDDREYDSAANTGDELNKLIREANSMDYNQFNPPTEGERAEILYPSLRKDRPTEQNLNSRFFDAFARIAPETSPTKEEKPERTSYSGIPRPSNSDFGLHPDPNKPKKKRKKSIEMAVDGDDEISLAESDFKIISEPQQRNISEIYPSDYTDFETASEVEQTHESSSSSSSSSASESEEGGVDAYDTVADAESDNEMKGKLNPIVNDKYQICTDMDAYKSRSFPRRVKQHKPKKDHPASGAISLSQFNRPTNAYPNSMPYYHHDNDIPAIRRTGSADDMLADFQPMSQHPQITVVRDQPHSLGYQPPVQQEVLVRAPEPDTPKKKKKKKEKKEKEKDKQITVQVNQVDASGNPVAVGNNNNLHINLLPSSDPNIINLNIRSTSNANPVEEHVSPVVVATQQAPITVVPSEPQHRIVDVSDQPTPINIAQPVHPSAGDAHITSTTGVVLAGSMQPNFGPGMIPTTAFPGQPFVPANQLYPNIPDSSMPMTQSFTANRVIESNADLPPTRSLPQEPEPTAPKVVEIDNPWPASTHGSLPGHSSEHQPQLHGGDSGIDLTLNDRSNRQSRRKSEDKKMSRLHSRKSQLESSEESSSESSDNGRRSRTSQKRLKSTDYLQNSGKPSMEYIQWYKSQYMRPSCMFICIKHFFFTLNLLFTILGLALIGLGIYGMVNLYLNNVHHIESVVIDPLFMVLIMGIVIALIAFHGAAGFVRNNICMLKFFGSLLILLLLATIAGCITFWIMQDEAKLFATKTFNRLIKNYDVNRQGLVYTLDTIQNTFDCCGFSSEHHTQWGKSSEFPCIDDVCQLPRSCCRDSANPQYQCGSESDLLRDGSCIDKLSGAIQEYTAIIIAVWIGIWVIIIIQFIAIFLMRKEIAYLKKVEGVINYPEKMSKRRIMSEDEEEDNSEEESSSESSSSSEEERYRRRQMKKNKRRKNKVEKRRYKENRRTGSYHINSAFSMDDERRDRSKKRRKNRRR